MENVFHACDIGNPALEFDNYMNWSILLAHEFNSQAELERGQGLEVTANFSFRDMKAHYQGQIGFIGKILPYCRLFSLPTLEINRFFLPRIEGAWQDYGQQQVQAPRTYGCFKLIDNNT